MQDSQSQRIANSVASKYKLELRGQLLELPIAIEKDQLNEILEQLSSQKLVEKIYTTKDELESYFTEE